MSNLLKNMKGIKSPPTAKTDYSLGISEDGNFTRTTGEEYYKVGWTNELIELPNATPNTEGTPIHFQTTLLQAGYERHIKQNYAYDDNSARPIGVIQSIGGNVNLTTDDWAALDTRRVIITAQDGCWFNIANNGSEVSTTKTKKILTQTNGNIEKCIKAVFTYDHDRSYWIVESYELLEGYQRYWFRKYTFDGTDITSPVEFDLPWFGDGLPYIGYYKIDVFAEVEEVDAGPTKVNTLAPHSMAVKARTSGTYFNIDVSGNFTPPPAAPTAKWVNNSLQGSAIVEVTGADCADRGIVIKITLPNTATYKNVSDGYAHVKYLGSQIGNDC